VTSEQVSGTDEEIPPPETSSTDHLGRTTLVASLALILVGAVVRVILLGSAVGPADADESVVLLMAKDMVNGHFETFFWGQEYGGTQEALLVAALARLGVPLRWGGEIVTIGLSVAAAVLLWRIVKTSVGAEVALLTGALYWSTPIAFVWLSQKERGFYGSSAVSCLAALLFATRLLQRPNLAAAVGLGISFGSALWSSPQTLYLLVPIALWLVGDLVARRRWHLLRLAPAAALAAIVGGAPWLWTNARTGLASLHVPPTTMSTPGERVSLYWRLALPQVSSFKLPYNPTEWIGTRALLVPHLGLVVLAVVGAALLARKVPWVPLALAWHPILFASLSTGFFVIEPRYLFLLWPTAALAIAYLALRYGRGIGAVAVAGLFGGLTAVGCSLLIAQGAAQPGFFDLQVPRAPPVVAAMKQLGVSYAYAEYWTSYPLEVASGGDVVATPLYQIRDPRREQRVQSAGRVAYVLYSRGCAEEALDAAAALDGQRAPARLEPGGPFAVIVPERPIPPQVVVRRWANERGSNRPDLPDCRI